MEFFFIRETNAMNPGERNLVKTGGKGGPRPGSGRKPKAATILKAKLADFAGDALRAFKFNVQLMDDATQPMNLRQAASREIMDRLWGKPKQAVEHSGSVNMLDLIIQSTGEGAVESD